MRKLLLLVCMCMCIVQSWAQNRTITGKVLNEKGEAISNASILVKGTSNGVKADVNGNFTLQVNASAQKLIISSLNYLNEEVDITKNTASINVVLKESAQHLTEVVVTALGVKRDKKALGYAVQSITSEQLTEGANPNLATAIQGKVAGVEVRPSSGMPGASAQVIIRGSRFFSGDNTPLYVIDGMPVSSSPDFVVGNGGVAGTDFSGRSIDIDPNDIESLDVLKGQAAAALYGMRASNGVIMITTKSGKGLKKGAPIVSFSTNYQVDNVSRFPQLQTQYGQGTNGVFNNFTSTSWGPLISDLPNDLTYGGNAYNGNDPSKTHGMYWNVQKGQWVTPQAYNNPKDFFLTGHTAANNLSIAQSGEMGNYSIGLGATNQSGIIPSSKMNRYNAKFAGEYNASATVKVGASMNYSNTSINKIPTGNNSILFEIFGAPISYDMKGTPYNEAGNPYKQIGYRSGTFENPYWAVQYNKFNEKTSRLFGNTYISYNPIKQLTIRYQIGIDQYTTDREQIYELGSASTSGATFQNKVPSTLNPSGGSILNGALMNTTLNSLLTATYNKKFNNDWRFNAIIGNEINNNVTRNISASGTGFNVGGWDNMANTSTQTSTEAKYKNRTVGFFGNVGLDWRNMLFLNLTGRNDIVSTMPSDNRSFFYPSASLGWVFTELKAFKGKDFYGKIRGSYAEVGAPGQYYPPVYVKGSTGSGFLTYGITYPFNGVSGYVPNTTLYDPNLKPQNTHSVELGIELKFLKGRIGLDYTYAKQDTKNQIFSVPLAGSTGFSTIVKNGGEMSSGVHEIVLSLIPVKSKNFQWNLTGNFSTTLNKVVALAPGVTNISLGGFVDPQVRAAIGYTYPSIFGTAYARNEKGEIVVDSRGMPLAAANNKVIGSVTPKFILGVNNTFRYKFMQLSVLVDWKNGGQMYSGSNRLIDLYGTSIRTATRATDEILIKGVTAATATQDAQGNYIGGDENKIAIKGANNIQTLYNSVLGSISEANVYTTSYVKLREVALSFDLPRTIFNKTKFIRSAAVSVSARNILLWTSLPNFDPESSQGNGNMQSGFDYMSLPQTRSIGLGLHCTF